jgi:alginate O-acetyltransferase complex protein AlgI
MSFAGIDTKNVLQNLGRIFHYDPASPMLFNSGQFLVLFSVFFVIYALIYKWNKTLRIIYVVAFSLLFYYKASGWYLFILLLSIVIDYFIAFLIEGSKTNLQKKIWLIISISANIGLLCYFKYTNFFIDNINSISGSHLKMLNIFLPIGISFYTFQTLSYVIDIYRGLIKPTRNILDYAFYMSFFPHLVAGPIVRAKNFLPQVRQDIVPDGADFGNGFFLIIKGLIKKAIIADYIAQYVDIVFQHPSGFSGLENLIAMYAYTLQIYCDFSGYSDMAIGIAKLMGYQLGINFDAPYIATSVTEFWRRWHISLSGWLRDYIYIPLGGNRKGVVNQYVFLFITMLIGGLWHGASWKFVVWGAVHGLGLVIHKLWKQFGKDRFKWFPKPVSAFLGWIITFHFVAVLWVFFRASTYALAMESLKMMVFNMHWNYIMQFVKVHQLFTVLILLGFMIHFIPENFKISIQHKVGGLPMLAKALVLVFIIQIILQIQLESVQPFIYFQF